MEDIFRFANPQYLYLLILVPLLALLLLYFSERKKRSLQQFGKLSLISHLMPEVSRKRTALKASVLLLAFTLQVLVVAGPQFGAKLETMKRKGIEIMIALDVSNSMNAPDITPSRLEMAKMAVSRLVDKLSNDRVGMVVFAGQAYIQLPITSDYPSAKMFLSSISTNMIDVQGTAIGSAINLCANSFSPDADVNKTILVITDGENHEDDAVQATAAAFSSKGIRTYTVGMGSSKGSPIPVRAGSTSDFIKDSEGNVVITKIDEDALMQIASAGGGAYMQGNNIRDGINNLLSELNHLEKKEFETKVYTEYNNRFQYVEILVLLLIIFDLLILEKRNPRLKGIDIFKRNGKVSKDYFIEPK